jgi:DNA-binding transcriptional LysR family regulator
MTRTPITYFRCDGSIFPEASAQRGIMKRLSDIDLRLLRIFTTIVDCNGFKNAQIALNMAPSTLSSHLSTLEGRIGSRLCDRGRRGFRLTRAGEETYQAAQELFRSIDRFGATVARMHRQEQTRLRLGVVDTIESFGELNFAEAVATFVREFPRVFLEIEVMPPQQLQVALVEGRRDLIVTPAFRAGNGIFYREIALEQHKLYCARSHPWFMRPDSEISSLDFASAGLSVRAYQYFDDAYKLGGVRASASVSNMEAQEILILSGCFVGFLPIHRGDQRVLEGRMRAVKPQEWSLVSRFAVAYRETTELSMLKRSFTQALLRAGRSSQAADPASMP